MVINDSGFDAYIEVRIWLGIPFFSKPQSDLCRPESNNIMVEHDTCCVWRYTYKAIEQFI